MSDERGGLIVVSKDELRALVEDTMRRVLNDNAGPPLVDKQAIAQLLHCSPTQVDHLRKKGLPCVKAGNLVRFEPAKVLAWLHESGAA
jgi:hypothetical protein